MGFFCEQKTIKVGNRIQTGMTTQNKLDRLKRCILSITMNNTILQKERDFDFEVTTINIYDTIYNDFFIIAKYNDDSVLKEFMKQINDNEFKIKDSLTRTSD